MKKIFVIAFLFISQVASASYRRIISTSPAITEIIYTLGAQERLVGVTPYCFYPEAARKLEKTGTPFDFDTEKALGLKADLVLLGKTSNQKVIQNLSTLKIKHETLAQARAQDIMNSVLRVAELTGNSEKGKLIVEQMKVQMRKYHRHSLDLKTKVLVIIGHQTQANGFKDFFVMGKDTFYQDILDKLKLVNAYQGDLAKPILSNEDLIRLNPDVIIDIIPPRAGKSEVEKVWQQNYGQLKAGKKKKIFVYAKDYALIPGPRFINIVADFHKMVN